MAATSKRVKKNAGSAKKQASARSLPAEATYDVDPSPVSKEIFEQYIYALVSFQQFASWYYREGQNGTPNSRAAEITKDIIRLEKKYMKKGDQGLAQGRCPAGWIDCGGLCMEPGSVCR